jgi:hypothetical protein
MRNAIWVLVVGGAMLAGCTAATDRADDAPELACPEFSPGSGGLPETGEWRTHPSVGDVDGDGLPDIAALARKARGPRVFLSDGMGSWTEASAGLEYPKAFSCGVGTRLADLGGDGRLDLVIADHCTGVAVYRGDGRGNWTEESRGIPRNLEGFNDADVGDLDADGQLDIVALSAFTRGFLVLHGRSDGSWEYVRDSGLPASGNGWQVLLQDVDRDGRLDVLGTYNPVSIDRRFTPPAPAKVWLQDAQGRFRPAAGFPTEGRFFGVAVAPRKGESVPDLLLTVSGYRAGLYAWRSPNGETWSEHERIDVDWSAEPTSGFTGIRTADFDGDGCLDIVTAEASSGTLHLALGDCAGHYRRCPDGTFPSGDKPFFAWSIAEGDLNADGRLDLVSASGTKHGGLRVWLQRDRGDHGQGPEPSSIARGSGSTPDAAP